MRGYRRGHNSVAEVSFQVSQSLPQSLTFYEQVDLKWIREQVRLNPLVTLQQLCDRVKEQTGASMSITHMKRVLLRAGVRRVPGSRSKQVPA